MLPRPEYPRPQFVRQQWLNLNGNWKFAEDAGDTGEERSLHKAADLPETITLPFCRESELSGIGRTDRVLAVWYQRSVEIPADWSGKDILLHFGAADYETTVWVEGQLAGTHFGGHTSFSVDLSNFAQAGQTVSINIRCRDDWYTPKPVGKQSPKAHNFGIHYTRTTGIWQTLWLEPVPKTHFKRPRVTPCQSSWAFQIEQGIWGKRSGCTVQAQLLNGQKEIATASVAADCDFTPSLWLTVPEDERTLWQPGKSHLYDIVLTLIDSKGNTIDEARTYAGMRSTRIEGRRFLINNEPVFQRLILDQGYYPDGILTAPSDEALRGDIELAMQAGFNGARLHQKIFEERFLYHADRLGYLVWGELPDWGPAFCTDQRKQINVRWVTEWQEELERDYSHPSIIAWGCLNEQEFQNEQHFAEIETVMRALFQSAKLADRTRPVLDASGWIHLIAETDIYDVHDYEGDPDVFRNTYADLPDGKIWCPKRQRNGAHKGQPYFVSEFGGIRIPGGKEVDGQFVYGETPENMEAFYERFKGLCDALMDNADIFGYCYTQLTDVYQEVNGVYDFSRQPKCDVAQLHQIQTRKAACEKE